ncbi:zinc-ribbon domain-containing protein [Metabacillus sp. Hm71]|uniref:zinc-ribbon domain-containing protein n=1 Tax=Metabacillus sp. Hm71 TaxID=3450743 RepID=UPI003F4333BE
MEQKVKIRWIPSNKKLYTEKGYLYTKMGDEFEVDISDLSSGSNEIIKYKCDYCGEIKEKIFHSYNVSRKKLQKDSCNMKFCKNKKKSEYLSSKPVPAGESVEDKYPHLIKDWDFDNNNGKTLRDFKPQSNKKVWWKCADCNHGWPAIISSRTRLGRSCPKCAGQIVTEENNLYNSYPDIAKWWHPTKNGTLTPYDVTKHSSKSIWWMCDEGHEWEVSVDSRTTFNSGCPYCTGKKAHEKNCLATYFPEISKEWHPTANEGLTPYDVRPRSNKKVWWLCKEGHELKIGVDHRVRSDGCSVCSESKGEKRVRMFLETNNIMFKSQYKFKDLIGINGGLLKFDFAIFNPNKDISLLIEFDGIFHFGKIYVDDYYERTVEHDKRKDNYCLKNNIPLLRIPYWEMKNIEKILEKELIKYK